MDVKGKILEQSDENDITTLPREYRSIRLTEAHGNDILKAECLSLQREVNAMRPDQDRLIEQLYQKYFGMLTLYATASLKNQSCVQDVVQDTFHEAINHADVLMQHPNPAGWLKLTLKNKVKEEQRRMHKYALYFLSLERDLFTEPGRDDPNLEQPFHSEPSLASVIKRIKHVLTEEEFTLLKRLTIDQASHVEVAEEFGISVYASQKRLERIRKKLKKALSDQKN